MAAGGGGGGGAGLEKEGPELAERSGGAPRVSKGASRLPLSGPGGKACFFLFGEYPYGREGGAPEYPQATLTMMAKGTKKLRI